MHTSEMTNDLKFKQPNLELEPPNDIKLKQHVSKIEIQQSILKTSNDLKIEQPIQK